MYKTINEEGEGRSQPGPVDAEGASSSSSSSSSEHKDTEKPTSPYKASPESRFSSYEVRVDHYQNDRATEIKLCSFKRPHSRALHCAWISFFLAFTVWFAVAPLLPEIADSLLLTKEQIWTSSICSDATTILLRFIVGPLCDNYGSRIPMGVVLCLAAIPAGMVGLVNTSAGFSVLRLFIGIAGSTFVMAQHWPTTMYTNETAGLANGIVGGWGNLGGPFTQILMGTILFPAFTSIFGGNREKAWRVICIFPAVVTFIWGVVVVRISDDAPMGYYREMKKRGTMDLAWFAQSIRSGSTDLNTWILWWQYACCFGVELIMNNTAVLYFTERFGLSLENAAAVGSIFGWMNIFARCLGGLWSDRLNLRMGMRGRLWLQTICLLFEGAMILVFGHAQTLAGAIVSMCIFSIFTQAAEGAIYGVVPYVNSRFTGTVSGIVGAGGNAGSVVFGLGFRSLTFRSAFLTMGIIVMSSSLLSLLIRIPHHAGIISGEDAQQVIEARRRHIQTITAEVTEGNGLEGDGSAELCQDLEIAAKNEEKIEPGGELGGDLHAKTSQDQEIVANEKVKKGGENEEERI